jgi:hypothetical protein
MGIIKQGILGGFKGKVGGIIGTSWKGKAVIKAIPLSVANPRTAGQVKQRSKMKLLVAFAVSIIASTIKPLWDRFASGMSGYNAFVAANMQAFNLDGSIDPTKIIVSKGRMLPVDVTAFTINGTTVTVRWTDPTGDKYAMPTDNAYIVLANADLTQVVYQGQTTETRGTTGTHVLAITLQSTAAALSVKMAYVSYMRADNSEVSTSGNYKSN